MLNLTRIATAAKHFRRNRSGQVAVIFGLSLVPVLFASGAAIDYGRRNAAKVRLDAALDASLLAVLSRASNTVDAATITAGESQFRKEAMKLSDVAITSFSMVPTVAANNAKLTASYDATVKTILGSFMGYRNMKISSSATSQRNVFQYIDFYLLLDNSPSMGLAATDADQAKMQSLTPDSCAFACHKHTFNSKGVITGDEKNDYYQLARKNSIKLRIDNLREAVINLVDTAKASMKLSSQYRMEVWTFSDFQTKISSLTASLDQTKTDAQAIDLAYALYGEPDNQTSYERALPKMNSVIPSSGTGLTAVSPIRFLFFVTDGVQDTPIDGSVTDPTTGYKINSNRWISTLTPSLCKSLKDRDVRIGIIYTMYLPLPANAFYNSYVKPFQDKIPTNLKACASDGLFFPVSTGGDINAAMQTLFQTAVASVRLTQ